MEVEASDNVCGKCGDPLRVSPKGYNLCCAAAKQRRWEAAQGPGYAEIKAKKNKVWRENNGEKVIADKRAYYEKNWVKIILYQARLRAARKNVPFSLTLHDITIPAVCPVLGLTLKFAQGKPHDNSPAIDRIVPLLGYVPGNVTVISTRANRLKNDGTAEEHERIAKWLRGMTE